MEDINQSNQPETNEKIHLIAAGIDLSTVEIENSEPILQYPNIDVERFKFGKVREMETAKKDVYRRVDVEYLHGRDEKNLVAGPMYWEGYEVLFYGLKVKVQDGKESWSVFVIHHIERPEVACYVNQVSAMYNKTAAYLHSVRGAAKMAKFDIENPTATGFRYPIVYPTDEETCEVIDEEPPFEWYNLVPIGRNKTVITFPGAEKGEDIEWKDLIGVKFKGIPCFHYSHIYIGGGKMSMQQKLISITLTSPPGFDEGIARNIGTAKALAKANPELTLQIRSQLEIIKTIRVATVAPEGGKKEEEHKEEKEEQNEEETPTFSALKGSVNPAKPPPSIKASASTPKINAVPKKETKKTFA